MFFSYVCCDTLFPPSLLIDEIVLQKTGLFLKTYNSGPIQAHECAGKVIHVEFRTLKESSKF